MRPPSPRQPTNKLYKIYIFSLFSVRYYTDVCKCQLHHFAYCVSIKKIKDEDKDKQTVTLITFAEYVPNTHQQNPSITV